MRIPSRRRRPRRPGRQCYTGRKKNYQRTQTDFHNSLQKIFVWTTKRYHATSSGRIPGKKLTPSREAAKECSGGREPMVLKLAIVISLLQDFESGDVVSSIAALSFWRRFLLGGG